MVISFIILQRFFGWHLCYYFVFCVVAHLNTVINYIIAFHLSINWNLYKELKSGLNYCSLELLINNGRKECILNL